MGERYLKSEEAVILAQYPTSRRWKILSLISGRTWVEIGAKARKMGIHRNKEAKGDSIREGRKKLKHSWSDADNERLDSLYPIRTYSQLLAAFPERSLKSIRSHAQKRHLHRTREAVGKQINIGRSAAKEEWKDKNA